MNTDIEKLLAVQKYAIDHRPAVGGFPFMAECMRQAGVLYNRWSLPSAQSIYILKSSCIVIPGTPLITDIAEIPVFDQDALIKALRIDQAGESTFGGFLHSAWKAGVVHYEVDFTHRTVDYRGIQNESYTESYPAVQGVSIP